MKLRDATKRRKIISMYRKDLSAIDCSTARALDQVGEWWSLLIVRECTLGTKRFDEFQRRLDIARNVLTNRLNHLCETGIMDKVPVGDSGRRFEYRLTPKGEALYPVLVALMQWGDKWASPNGQGGPIQLVENSTGKPVTPVGPRAEGGPVLTFRDVRLQPAPWASDYTRGLIDKRNQAILGEPDTEEEKE